MPKKPIKQGYKIFAIAEGGYIWTFCWSSCQLGIAEIFKYPTLKPTGSMVVNMVKKLPTISGIYSIYMDNYFTSIPLFELLHEQGYGACGTTWPTKEFSSQLQELHDNHSNSIPSGALYGTPVKDVLCLIWQDNNLVPVLSTIHSMDNFVDHMQKRPGKTSTNAAIARKVFGDYPKRELAISTFIDDYNHYMNGVDIGNQMRASYTTHLVTLRNWLPILYWILDAAIINAFRIQHIYMQQQGIKPLPTQSAFREKLYQELFENSATLDELSATRLSSQLNHQQIRLGKERVCAWCAYKRKKNQKKGSKHAGCSRSGCSVCKVPLCNSKETGRSCWEEFHS